MAKSYKYYQQEIANLQKKADEARRTELAGAIAQIKSLMNEFNLTIKDLKLKDGRPKKGAKASAIAKYKDPVSGASWSGRGRRPAWVIQAKAENKLDSLLVATPAKVQAAKAAPKQVAKKASNTESPVKTADKPVVKPASRAKKVASKKPAAKKSVQKQVEPQPSATTVSKETPAA